MVSLRSDLSVKNRKARSTAKHTTDKQADAGQSLNRPDKQRVKRLLKTLRFVNTFLEEVFQLRVAPLSLEEGLHAQVEVVYVWTIDLKRTEDIIVFRQP